jgi:hypothetical protein
VAVDHQTGELLVAIQKIARAAVGEKAVDGTSGAGLHAFEIAEHVAVALRWASDQPGRGRAGADATTGEAKQAVADRDGIQIELKVAEILAVIGDRTGAA